MWLETLCATVCGIIVQHGCSTVLSQTGSTLRCSQQEILMHDITSHHNAITGYTAWFQTCNIERQQTFHTYWTNIFLCSHPNGDCSKNPLQWEIHVHPNLMIGPWWHSYHLDPWMINGGPSVLKGERGMAHDTELVLRNGSHTTRGSCFCIQAPKPQ